MFNNKRLKAQEDDIDQLRSAVNMALVKAGEANKNLKVSASPFVLARIKAVDATGALFKYTWEAIKLPASGYQMAVDTMVGGSGASTAAYCIQELDRDLTGKTPLGTAGQIVLIVRTGAGFFFSVGGMLDVRYDPTEDKFYKTGADGQETVWAQSTLYPPTTTNE